MKMVTPCDLVKRHGGRYARALGIDLAAPDAGERFRWFLAAMLYGARIPESLATRTWHEFAVRGVLTPARILTTGWEGLVAILDAGGYVRYDYKTATKLLEVCDALMRDYGGSLDALHDAAADPRDLENRLKALGKGIGDTTVGIFLRELRGIWPRAEPPLSPLALAAAETLGYLRPPVHDTNRALAQLQQVWAADGQPASAFAEFEAALVREGLRLRTWPCATTRPDLLRQVVMADAHALGLQAVGNRAVLDEFHGVALVELGERGVHQIVGVEIQFVAIGAPDEAITLVGIEAHHLADVFRIVGLGFAAQAPGIVVELAPGRIEGVAQGDIHVFVPVAVHHDFAARHADVDAHVEEFSLMLVLVRHFHHHPAGHDGLEEGLQFLGLVADMRLEGIGMLDIAKRDLQRRFHLVVLPFGLRMNRSVPILECGHGHCAKTRFRSRSGPGNAYSQKCCLALPPSARNCS